MHIWRLTCHPAYQALKFPQPIKINGRNYWKASVIDRWMASRERAPREVA
jgi:predicted DNA-binding transcriptional regulator AlpA